MSISEIKALRQRIEEECAASLRGLYGYASVAKHAIIAHSFEVIGQYEDQLARLVGPEEAGMIAMEAYQSAMGGKLPTRGEDEDE